MQYGEKHIASFNDIEFYNDSVLDTTTLIEPFKKYQPPQKSHSHLTAARGL